MPVYTEACAQLGCQEIGIEWCTAARAEVTAPLVSRARMAYGLLGQRLAYSAARSSPSTNLARDQIRSRKEHWM